VRGACECARGRGARRGRCTLNVSVAPQVHTPTALRPRRGERFFALVGLIVAGAVPAVLYHDLLAQVVGNFTLDAGYIAFGASGFTLMAAGLLAALPVVLSIGRDPDSRLYPRSRGALAGWGISLYLLGAMLVIQIGAIAAGW
jgi:hypothetical protein